MSRRSVIVAAAACARIGRLRRKASLRLRRSRWVGFAGLTALVALTSFAPPAAAQVRLTAVVCGETLRHRDGRLLAAAANNATWCDIVCRAHGIGTVRRDGIWFTPRAPAPLYPYLVTLAPGVGTSDVMRSVGDRKACAV